MHFKAMSPTKIALRSIPHMECDTGDALPNFVERQGARDPSCRDFLHDLSTSITLVDKLDDLSRSRRCLRARSFTRQQDNVEQGCSRGRR